MRKSRQMLPIWQLCTSTAICGNGVTVHTQSLSVHRNMDLESEVKEYKVSVRTNDIHEAIAKTGTALAALVDEALLSHEPHEIDEECEFEEFARDLLRVLTAHSDALASSEEADTDV